MISAGVAMGLRSLNEQTATLPLCSPAELSEGGCSFDSRGYRTGCNAGVLYELEGHIARFGAREGKKIVLFLQVEMQNILINKLKMPYLQSAIWWLWD